MPHRNGPVGNRAKLAEQALKLRADGFKQREIAAALGISRSYASALVVDPDGSKDKARKDNLRRPCVDCGVLTNGSDGLREEPRCSPCFNKTLVGANLKWPKERIIEAILWWNDEYGEPPTTADWNSFACRNKLHDEERAVRFERLFAEGKVPWFTTVMRRFGTFNKGLEAAGFKGHVNTGSGGNIRRMRRYMQTEHPRWMPNTKGAVMEALVLRKNGAGWIEVGTTEARSYQDAVENLATDEGEYVAIPSSQRFTVAPREKLVATPKGKEA